MLPMVNFRVPPHRAGERASRPRIRSQVIGLQFFLLAVCDQRLNRLYSSDWLGVYEPAPPGVLCHVFGLRLKYSWQFSVDRGTVAKKRLVA